MQLDRAHVLRKNNLVRTPHSERQPNIVIQLYNARQSHTVRQQHLMRQLHFKNTAMRDTRLPCFTDF